MQASDSPDKISLAFASGGTRNDIPEEEQTGENAGAASYTTGFPPITSTDPAAGGIPPKRNDFNGIFYAVTNLLRWQNSGGTFTFDQALSDDIGGYPQGALLLKADGSGFWRSEIDDNTNDPDTVGTGWVDVVPVASETIAGILEIATQNEVNTGSDTTRAITPSTLMGRTATESRTGLAAIASQTEVNEGAEASKIVTPETLSAWTNPSSQFSNYNTDRTYTTGETVRGSDGQFYEFYDRDQMGTVQGVDPTNPANRPHIWMIWDGVKPGTTIAWRSETLPEGYLPNDGWQSAPRQDYRRIFAAFGTTWGAGDGSTTFGMPNDEDEFLRGWDPNGSRALAEHQSDAFRTHNHLEGMRWDEGSGTPSEVDAVRARFEYDISLTQPAPTEDARATEIPTGNISGSGYVQGYTSTEGSSETRPPNNAVIYLTKI